MLMRTGSNVGRAANGESCCLEHCLAPADLCVHCHLPPGHGVTRSDWTTHFCHVLGKRGAHRQMSSVLPSDCNPA